MEKITVSIDGMMCEKCENRMNEAFRQKLFVKNVSSSHDKKESVFEIDKEISDEAIKNIVEETGYKFLGVKREQIAKKKFLGIFG